MFGMTEAKIKKAKYKIKCNKAFLNSHGIEINNSIIPFSKFVANSYINSDRYIAELQHRAHSISDYAKKKGLSNVFLTLTLPTEWHPMKQKSKYDKTLIFNKKYGGRKYITKIVHPTTGEVLKLLNTKDNIAKYQPRNASKELSKLLTKLYNERSYRKIDKDDRCFFRVTEPHKDGTPHLHISYFMPKEYINDFVSSINRLFPSPQSKIVLDVDSPVHYLMKYILKTLDDLRNDSDKLTSLTLWYVYNGIARFYTSRTFLSLDIYRKLKGMYTLNELKECYTQEELTISYYANTKEIAKIDNVHGTIYISKPLIGEFSINKWKEDMKEYNILNEIDPDTLIEIPVPIVVKFSNPQWREDMENEDNTYFEYEFEPIKIIEKKPMKTYLEDGEKLYLVKDGLLSEIKIKPYEMTDLQLFKYFENIDIDTVNMAHYGVTRNIMIERGLLDAPKLGLDEFTEEVF